MYGAVLCAHAVFWFWMLDVVGFYSTMVCIVYAWLVGMVY